MVHGSDLPVLSSIKRKVAKSPHTSSRVLHALQFVQSANASAGARTARILAESLMPEVREDVPPRTYMYSYSTCSLDLWLVASIVFPLSNPQRALSAPPLPGPCLALWLINASFRRLHFQAFSVDTLSAFAISSTPRLYAVQISFTADLRMTRTLRISSEVPAIPSGERNALPGSLMLFVCTCSIRSIRHLKHCDKDGSKHEER